MMEFSIAKQFGVVDKDQQRAMGGLEFVRGLDAMITQARATPYP